jgi:hypothetical protein
MKGIFVVGVLLMVFGVFVLAYPAIHYTTEDKVLEIGPVKATAEHEKTLPLHPAVGGAALAGGGLLLVLGVRRNRSGGSSQ